MGKRKENKQRDFSVKGEERWKIKMEKTDKKMNKYWAPKKHIVVGEIYL